MFLIILAIIVALAVGSYLLALVSETFAFGLSRGVEAIFDFFEYKAALRSVRTGEAASRSPQARVSYRASYSRAA
jgi:hypothetical protein